MTAQGQAAIGPRPARGHKQNVSLPRKRESEPSSGCNNWPVKSASLGLQSSKKYAETAQGKELVDKVCFPHKATKLGCRLVAYELLLRLWG